MSYDLNAVIGDFDRLRRGTPGIPEAVVAPLRQRLGLVPVTAGGLTVEASAFERTLGEWSRGGPVALVEAEFFGGEGYQVAEVWRDGVKVWGPVRDGEFAGVREEWPINGALARLGAVSGGESRDLFREVGLGWERDNEGWESAGRAARWAATYDEWHEEFERAERQRR
ncbi:MAG TPA: hypothetical protein VIU15_05350 [Streptomyces sp.]